MNQIVGVTEFQKNIKKNLDLVVSEQTSIVLTRGSRPQAVITPYDEYQALKSLERKMAAVEFAKLLEEIHAQNKDVSEKELEEDLKMVEKELRRKRNAKSRR